MTKTIMEKGIEAVLRDQVFLSAVANKLTVYQTPDGYGGQFVIDERMNLHYPGWVGDLNARDLDHDLVFKGQILHQLLHVAYKHPERMGRRDISLWNYAADIGINKEILDAGYSLPSEAVTDPTGQYDGKSVEEIYALLEKDHPTQESSTPDGYASQGVTGKFYSPDETEEDDGDGDGDGDGDKGDSEEEGAPIDRNSEGMGGERAGGMHLLVKPPKEASGVNWAGILHNFIDDKCQQDFTWSQPNRRHIHSGLYLPGTEPDGINHIICCVDTSGSISDYQLQVFLRETQNLLDNTKVNKVTIYDVDTRINAIHEYSTGEIIGGGYEGGGGNDFGPFFRHINKMPNLQEETPCVLVFTDMQISGSEWGLSPQSAGHDVPVIWLAYGHKNYRRKPPFGEVISITK